MYDIIIIGAGPGGYETALAAANRGLTVLLVESGPLGGTCLNEGCIPTKALCRNAEIWSQVKKASEFGITAEVKGIDFPKVQERKAQVVAQLRGGVEQLMKHKNITLVRGRASFVDKNTITVQPVAAPVEEGVAQDAPDMSLMCTHGSCAIRFQGKNIIVATGSLTASLPIPGADLPGVITSKELLETDHVPERLCIIGAGVIGLEFASIFNEFGSKVTVVEYCKEVLPRFDTDMAKRLRQSLGKKGIEIFTQAQVTSIQKVKKHLVAVEGESGIAEEVKAGLSVSFTRKDKEEKVEADLVLMAVGRRANLQSLNFDEVGIALEKRGVTVDEHMQTSVPGIYAIGDINGHMMLAHTAIYQGLVALDHIMGVEDKINLDVMPAAVFTRPEVGVVGLTEEDCKARGIGVKVLKAFHRANGKAVAMGETEGFCKIIVSEEDGKILGCHLFGEHSADIIQEICALMSVGAGLEELKAVVHPHPTLCEVIQSAAHSC